MDRFYHPDRFLPDTEKPDLGPSITRRGREKMLCAEHITGGQQPFCIRREHIRPQLETVISEV